MPDLGSDREFKLDKTGNKHVDDIIDAIMVAAAHSTNVNDWEWGKTYYDPETLAVKIQRACQEAADKLEDK